MRERLRDLGVTQRVMFDDGMLALLETMQIVPGEAGERIQLGVAERAFGAFDLNLTLPNEPRSFVLEVQQVAGNVQSFRLALSLNEGPPARNLFQLAQSLPGHALKAATRKSSDKEEWLEAVPGSVSLVGLEAAWVIKGKAGQVAAMTLSPSLAGPDAILTLGLEPPTVLLGDSGFGLELPAWPAAEDPARVAPIALDDSEEAAVPGRTLIDGNPVELAADLPEWRGLLIRHARLYLPKGVPFLGGHALDACVAIGLAPVPGMQLVLDAKVPAAGERPEISVRIECVDPTATGLASFIPTFVEASMTLPLHGRQESFAGPGGALQSITFGAGKPVIARARFARKPREATVALSLAVESQGPLGLLSVDSAGGATGAKAIIAAAALLTALVADKDLKEPSPGGDETGVYLHVLLTAATGLSAFLSDQGGSFVLHRAELVSEGQALGETFKVKLDYSVNVHVTQFNVGVLKIGMRPEQPMRVRVRDVTLSVYPERAGLEMFQLDVDHAQMDIEDPGGWGVNSPGSLFDILGTRSGRGSIWLEVDLRFKVELGPIKVSGATIRATFVDGKVEASLRGLDVSLDLSPTLSGRGSLQLSDQGDGKPPSLDALLAIDIEPLGLSAEATLKSQGELLALSLAVDLPGPLPLANSGLAVYGVGGLLAFNGRPRRPPAGQDPVEFELRWQPASAEFDPAPGVMTVGFEAVVGTAADLGFAFSARAGLFLSVPELAVRGSLAGKMLSPRVRLTDRDAPAVGLSAKGVVVVDPADSVLIGIEGKFSALPLLEVVVPIGARFPVQRAAPPQSSSDWYVHIGADGAPFEGRQSGPARAVILPDIFPQQADAYLMLRGDGIHGWPRGNGPINVERSFVAAFGFSLEVSMGLKGVLWAEAHARADVLLTLNPVMLAGFGSAGGSLNLGPISVGVDAELQFLFREGFDPYVRAELCGHVDLFFFEVSGCVDVTFGDDEEAKPRIPPAPPPHPLDPVGAEPSATLIDDNYRQLAVLASDPAEAPVVWADAIPHFVFSTAPKLDLPANTFEQLDPHQPRAVALGNDLLEYRWTLTSLELFDVTDGGDGVAMAGPYPATWLQGKHGDPGGQPEPAELALFTAQADLWAARASGGGEGLPHDPIAALADICQPAAQAIPGWALGGTADPHGASMVLAPDPLSANPLQSRVQAVLSLGCDKLKGSLDCFNADQLPIPFTIRPGRRLPLTPALELGRRFGAYLALSMLEFPPDFHGERFELQHQLDIHLADPLAQAGVWLVIDEGSLASLSIETVAGPAWQKRIVGHLADGAVVECSAPGGDVTDVVLRWPPNVPVGILGVVGVTLAARQAAAIRNAARAKHAAALQAAALAGPPGPEQPLPLGARTVLPAGRKFRIDIGMSWSATLYERSAGLRTELASDGGQAPVRQFYFRTAGPPAPRAPVGGASPFIQNAQVLHGVQGLGKWLTRAQHELEPEMLQRYLLGYEPAQTTLDQFRDGPLRIHFSRDHVAALAHAYGFDLFVAARRLDLPGAGGAQPQVIQAVLKPLTQASLLFGAARRRHELFEASPCALPKPGATLEARAQLEPRCWYELCLLARRADNAEFPLPGVSFRTSRFHGPADMLEALGFGQLAAGKASGDVALVGVVAAGDLPADDAAFDAALQQLGLEGWPTCVEPRTSLLWQTTADQGWLFRGVMLESPEAIHRPGRFEVKRLRVQVGAVDAGALFDCTRRDRSGHRLLFLASAEVRLDALAREGQIELQLDGLDAGVEIRGRLALEAKPAFAAEELQ
jgi:hypothetical protein